ncbi:hypothetical protein BLOT_015708 [Blomia tropicalis]|nr:hypothetical protein BLOT_015708 [Blomia tropicalis]
MPPYSSLMSSASLALCGDEKKKTEKDIEKRRDLFGHAPLKCRIKKPTPSSLNVIINKEMSLLN